MRNQKGTAEQPFNFYLNLREVFGFAGLWEEWLGKMTGELLEICTIITTQANKVVEPVHNRMPVVPYREDCYERLDKNVKDTAR